MSETPSEFIPSLSCVKCGGNHEGISGTGNESPASRTARITLVRRREDNMTKPMKPVEKWSVVDCEGWEIWTHDCKHQAIDDRNMANKFHKGKPENGYPFTVRRVLVTEIKKGKK